MSNNGFDIEIIMTQSSKPYPFAKLCADFSAGQKGIDISKFTDINICYSVDLPQNVKIYFELSPELLSDNQTPYRYELLPENGCVTIMLKKIARQEMAFKADKPLDLTRVKGMGISFLSGKHLIKRKEKVTFLLECIVFNGYCELNGYPRYGEGAWF
jgi:hypothetical protein